MSNRPQTLIVALWLFSAVTGHAMARPGATPAPSPFAPSEINRPAPSPLVPGDLKRPIFDTTNPSYDTAAKAANSGSTVVAEVDGRTVTLGEVGDAIRALPANIAAQPFPDVYPGVLSQLIRQQALVIRAQHKALDEDPVVRRRMRQASERVLANELLAQEISATITEADLLDRYNKDVAGKPGPEEVHLRVIMLQNETAAKNIIVELRAGADFAALARRSSIDATASAGGDAGFTTQEKLTREVGSVAFAMQPGTFTPFPVRAGDAWFVLKVDERRHQPARAFPTVREELRQAILRERVPGVIAAAMADVRVRSYDVTGKESEASVGSLETGTSQ